MDPLVSVLIPVYNAGHYLRPSVLSILEQTHRNLEIIIIDDGSTDGCISTISDLRDHRIKHLRQENSGKPVALNTALQIAQGAYYAIHDADDISYPRRIATLLQVLLQNRALAAAFSGHDLRLEDRIFAPRFGSKDPEECKKDIAALRMPAHDPTVMYRRSLVEDICYDPELPVVEGFDHILRVGEFHPVTVVGECLYSYRIHPASVTSQNFSRNNQLVRKVLEKAARRRGVILDKKRFPSFCNVPQKDPEGLVTQSMESVLDHRRAGQSFAALKIACECWKYRPTNLFYTKALVYWLLPLALIQARRARKAKG